MASWKDLEGVTLAEKFQLQELLFDEGTSACFTTRLPDESRPLGWLWLRLTEGGEFEPWQIAAGLSHPNLLQVWETGHTERGDTSMAYLLTEPADEDLAGVLRDRPLDQVEAREALLAAANALSYLHARGLVHGKVQPAAILAVGDQIKLSVDGVVTSVEAGDGGLSATDDLRGLGGCVHAMFTQSPETDLEHLSAIPQPFRDIIRGCYGMNPNERWTAKHVVATLNPPAEAATPVAKPSPLELPPPPSSPPSPPASRKRIPSWVFAVAGVSAAVLLLILTLLARKTEPDHSDRARPATAPRSLPAAGSRVARVPETIQPPPPLPSPLGPPIRQESPARRTSTARQTAPPAKQTSTKATDPSSPRNWRVVSYTYSRSEDADRMVAQINRKWPDLQAEPFSLNESGPPYLVALGGRMTRSDALALQQRAISLGLPPDTFARNFNK